MEYNWSLLFPPMVFCHWISYCVFCALQKKVASKKINVVRTFNFIVLVFLVDVFLAPTLRSGCNHFYFLFLCSVIAIPITIGRSNLCIECFTHFGCDASISLIIINGKCTETNGWENILIPKTTSEINSAKFYFQKSLQQQPILNLQSLIFNSPFPPHP